MSSKPDIQVLRSEIGKTTDTNQILSLYKNLISNMDAALEDYLSFAIYLRDSDVTASLQILDDAQMKFGENAWIEDNRARVLLILNRHSDAIDHWEKAISLASDSEKQFFSDEQSHAYNAFNKIISNELSNAKKNKEWDKVIAILNKHKTNQPKNLYLYLELCIAHRNKNNYKSALDILKTAEKLGLQSPWIHDNYARIFAEKKLYERAIRECLVALELSQEGGEREILVDLLEILKKQLAEEHSSNKYLHIMPVDVEKLLEQLFIEKTGATKIELTRKNGISNNQCIATFEALENKNITPNPNNEVKLIAYYLPQFHPIQENNEWWGGGFTEWTNVVQAKPYFKDHYQPHIPSELGYYDLRLPEVRETQAKLAKEYGIYGFCYYYYWFEGRRVLERPLQEVFESGQPDFPFCICWANENWSRRWDGSENEILIQQVHNEHTDEDFIHDVIPLFKDPRYIKVNGAPLLIIYRISLMPNPVQTAETWREICADNGIPEIHLCMAETFGLTEPRQYGFNSAVQFPPHNMAAGLENDSIEELPEDYTGNIYDFENVIKDQLARELPVYKQFPGVMTAWDNTARKKKAGNVFINATPETYEIWLRGAIDRAKQTLPEGEQLVFINAWNEWAEGTHLEPDQKNGRGYLEATRRALLGNSDWRAVLDYAEQLPNLAEEAKKNFLADIRFALDRLAKVNEHLLGVMGDRGMPKYWTAMKPGLPASWAELKYFEAGISRLENLNHYSNFNGQRVTVDSFQKLWVFGWAYHDTHQVLKVDTPTYIVLEDIISAETFFAPIIHRHEKYDVAEYNKNPNVLFSGIRSLIDISETPPSCYQISAACRVDKRVIMTPFNVEIEIV